MVRPQAQEPLRGVRFDMEGDEMGEDEEGGGLRLEGDAMGCGHRAAFAGEVMRIRGA